MGKTIAVGICGGIAAYKVADLVSRLSKEGHEVHVIMTEAGTRFITPLTMRTLSGNPVLTDVFEEQSRWKVQHIGIAEDIDLLVIAPASANTIAKLAHGMADNLLTAVALATRAPILVVPAMNTFMYENQVTQDNIQRLGELGMHVLEPASGQLACGVTGKGRLPEIDVIYEQVNWLLAGRRDLEGVRMVITSGATCEDIDPVRFITNRSTGKMGHALAAAAASRGASVVLVSGPTSLATPHGVTLCPVRSAREMCAEVLRHYEDCDVVIGAAAVADYRPADFSNQKIKKDDGDLAIRLTRNPDILATLGQNKGRRILVGFAAETQDILENGAAKMKKKNLDLLVANDVTMEGAGFGTDTNVVTLIDRNGSLTPLPRMSKLEVAQAILDEIAKLLKLTSPGGI